MALALSQIYIFQVSDFSLLNDIENNMYNENKKYSGQDKIDRNKKFENLIGGYIGIREIRKSAIKKAENFNIKNLVSLFENDLTRWINKNKPEFVHIMDNKKLMEGILVVKINHNGILKQIISNGVMCDGKRYLFYSASAGQQRENKITLIEESVYEGFVVKSMCGLSVNKINKLGGVNSGKFLAYTSLPLSASKPVNIDIDRVIVVPDMEINVKKPVKYIDNKTFEHKIIGMPDKLDQSDGCGMILPEALQEIQMQLKVDYALSGFQIRGPWIKGAMFPFDFKRFCDKHGVYRVKDLYGVQHDIKAENIQIILTQSQFKMWKYYSSWEEYKKAFKANNLSLSVTNVSNSPKDKTQLNYQFLQTLDRDKADHIPALCDMTINKIKKLHTDKSSMLEVFGAVDANKAREPLQEALNLYPAL